MTEIELTSEQHGVDVIKTGLIMKREGDENSVLSLENEARSKKLKLGNEISILEKAVANEIESPLPQPGVAFIKPEFIVNNEENAHEKGDVDVKKLNSDKEGSKKVKQRGQFKNRFGVNKVKTDNSTNLCYSLVDVPENVTMPVCESERCNYLHDMKLYMELKPPNIQEQCYVYSLKGHCPRGVTCRFSKDHLTEDGRNKINETIKENYEQNGLRTRSFLTKEIQTKLRKRLYDFKKSQNILDKLPRSKGPVLESSDNCEDFTQDIQAETKEREEGGEETIGPCPDEDLFKLHIAEKRKIDWKNKLYLSPLTTLGNVPFRRICREFGADVTCGEMAMASSILQGLPYEWALLKRHDSETLFGIQLCGNNPFVMTRCAQLLEEKTDIDFVDINLGCPIDLVYQRGGGSGLLRREKVLESVVQSMSRVMNLPLTIKTRTGVYADKKVAHKLMPKFRDAGVSLITVHGRSREQRYTRTSDWSYINECAGIASPTPVFGNGDILSFQDYNEAIEKYSNISGVMIGRGALYKPWIFTEIREQREWDITSGERFEILKKFVNYGLEHWGSDTKGVEITRKFVLEWLSFLYRYIPVGILEKPPQKINQRPPKYVGRNDLETLMASPNCSNWVKISEMLLGPVPENFQFLPKHKANSWSSE